MDADTPTSPEEEKAKSLLRVTKLKIIGSLLSIRWVVLFRTERSGANHNWRNWPTAGGAGEAEAEDDSNDDDSNDNSDDDDSSDSPSEDDDDDDNESNNDNGTNKSNTDTEGSDYSSDFSSEAPSPKKLKVDNINDLFTGVFY